MINLQQNQQTMLSSRVYPTNSNYEASLMESKRIIKDLESKYLSNQYQQLIASKRQAQAQEQSGKRSEFDHNRYLNENYLRDLERDRKRRLNQRQYLASEYESMLEQQNHKHQYQRSMEKDIEISAINAPTWLRDTKYDRQIERQKRTMYNQELADHVQMNQQRKRAEKEQDEIDNIKVSQEANFLLQKEHRYLEDRHKFKSMFQQRQNKLLGVTQSLPNAEEYRDNSPPFQQSMESKLRKRENTIYSQGLSLQLQKQMNSKIKEKETLPTLESYNPITNPIPFQYKNPNILKMIGSNMH